MSFCCFFKVNIGFLHFGVDNPVEVFVAFVRASGPALDRAEQPGTPVNALIGALSGFISLAVLDLGLFIGCGFMVLSQDRLDSVFP